jgi:hypothetical protein
MTLNIMDLIVTLSLNDTQHTTIGIRIGCHYTECRYPECLIFYCYAERHYAECRYAESRGAAWDRIIFATYKWE